MVCVFSHVLFIIPTMLVEKIHITWLRTSVNVPYLILSESILLQY